MSNVLRKLIIGLFLLPSLLQAEKAKLMHLHFSANATTIYVTFLLNQPRTPHLFSLSHPKRIVIDFNQTELNTALKNLPLSGTGIKGIRSGYLKPDKLRVVLDIDEKSQFKILSSAEATQVKLVLYTPPPPLMIVIDPGHGGRDPGAVGKLRTKEKNITLAIAKQLAALLNEQPNIRAKLTRQGDYFVPLRDRLRVARRNNADLFIAIHADSYFDTTAGGASVYAVSLHGATSEAARWLAKRENYSELGSVNLTGLNDQSYVLRSVLIDLAQTATIKASLHLGDTMLSELRQVTALHYIRVEQAPFVVLKSPDIPSVLVETGFLSNVREEENLNDKNYQMKIAAALSKAIQAYLKKYTTGVG